MSTLLKAYLIKTNDPFIMMKCYIEDILKQSNVTWEDFIIGLKVKPKKGIFANESKLYSQLVKIAKLLEENKNIYSDDKTVKPFSGRKEIKVESLSREDKETSETKTIDGDDVLHIEVLESNLMKLKQLIAGIKEEDAPVLKKIQDAIQVALVELRTIEDTKSHEKYLKTLKDGKSKEYKDGLKALEKILVDFKTKITRAVNIDGLGVTIYDRDVEESIDEIINPKDINKNIYALRQYQDGTIREKYEGLLEDLKQHAEKQKEEIKEVKIELKDKDIDDVIAYIRAGVGQEEIEIKEDFNYIPEFMLTEWIGLVSKIEKVLNEKIKYNTLEVKPREESLFDAIIYVISQTKKEGISYLPLEEHGNVIDSLNYLEKVMTESNYENFLSELKYGEKFENARRLADRENISSEEIKEITEGIEEEGEYTWSVN